MSIIKLTPLNFLARKCRDISCWENEKTFFDTSGCSFSETEISYYGKRYRCSVFNGVIVKETPEEIIEKIKEAENG